MKKFLIFIMTIATVFVFTACTDSATKEQQSDTVVSTTESTTKTEVTIPTDSCLADSVFDNVSNPTGTANKEIANDATEVVKENSTVDEQKPATDATAPNTKPEDMTYEAFTALTPAEQRLYQESFADLDAFFAWYSAAKEKYEKENPPIDIDGPIDLGKV